MQPDPVIAIGGENLIDSVQSTSPAGDVLCTDNLGGSPYNVAVALARQGVAAHYLTPISTDPFGQRLADHLTREGVIVAAPRSTAPTTRAIVSIENGVPHYQFLRDRARAGAKACSHNGKSGLLRRQKSTYSVLPPSDATTRLRKFLSYGIFFLYCSIVNWR
ncbi:MAG: hypothetical protein KC447_13930 [Rhodobacteraceae bacterium]|nr:hypothetical protein [Paracoccaceae bacterium]